MPIYAYKCSSCGHAFDTLQRVSDPALTDCPACGQPALAKQLTAAGFQLKGSGWYATDFKNGSAKPDAAAKPDAKVDAKTDAKADSKPDVKPDAKPESKAESNASSGAAKESAGSEKTGSSN